MKWLSVLLLARLTCSSVDATEAPADAAPIAPAPEDAMAQPSIRVSAQPIRPGTQCVTLAQVSAAGYSDAGNINFPRVRYVVGKIASPLGPYYMWFSGHDSHEIRLAYASAPMGPWIVVTKASGTNLTLDALDAFGNGTTPSARHADGHIASLDPHWGASIVDDHMCWRGWFHGQTEFEGFSGDFPSQDHNEWYAESDDGIDWTILKGPVGNVVEAPFFFSIFTHGGEWYSMSTTGTFRKQGAGPLYEWDMQNPAPGNLSNTQRARFFSTNVRSDGTSLEPRHNTWDLSRIAQGIVGTEFSRTNEHNTSAGTPERIMYAEFRVAQPDGTPIDWNEWQLGSAREIARAVESWEGGNEAVTNTGTGSAPAPKNCLMDPELFDDPVSRNRYRYYVHNGEGGIAVMQLNEATTSP